MLKYFLVIFFCYNFNYLQAQKLFFNKSGKSTSESLAYYYRVNNDKPNTYKCFYTSNDKLYFEGELLSANPSDDELNKYKGLCIWYYKNGNKKFERNYNNDGLLEGIIIEYYENGNRWKLYDYKKGKLIDNTYTEYNEEGTATIIFTENFDNNYNDWDLYTSDKSIAQLKDGKLFLNSLNKNGTSRFINLPLKSVDYVLESDIKIERLKANSKVGMLFGFKDWDNYSYFLISQGYFYVGNYYEGILNNLVDGMSAVSLQKDSYNNLKIICNANKLQFSINGEVVYNDDKFKLAGSNCGFLINGDGAINCDKLISKLKTSTNTTTVNSNQTIDDSNVKSFGSGLMLSTNGYIVTNQHVVKNSTEVAVEIIKNEVSKVYKAKVVNNDEENDLAILKIIDTSFHLTEINYSFKDDGPCEIGQGVFTIGYPLALNGMGKSAKFSDGKISAKSGYNGALNSYQTTAPIQPGNSGSPAFDDKGQLIGIVNASVSNTDNVSYVIKLAYLKNLLDELPENIDYPKNKKINDMFLTDKIKILTDYVVLIKIYY